MGNLQQVVLAGVCLLLLFGRSALLEEQSGRYLVILSPVTGERTLDRLGEGGSSPGGGGMRAACCLPAQRRGATGCQFLGSNPSRGELLCSCSDGVLLGDPQFALREAGG